GLLYALLALLAFIPLPVTCLKPALGHVEHLLDDAAAVAPGALARLRRDGERVEGREVGRGPCLCRAVALRTFRSPCSLFGSAVALPLCPRLGGPVDHPGQVPDAVLDVGGVVLMGIGATDGGLQNRAELLPVRAGAGLAEIALGREQRAAVQAVAALVVADHGEAGLEIQAVVAYRFGAGRRANAGRSAALGPLRSDRVDVGDRDDVAMALVD